MTQRQPRYRNQDLIELCRRADECYLRLPGCMGYPVAACHSNQQKHGRGMSYKSSDLMTIPGCLTCHQEIDYGKTMDRADKQIAWEAAWLRWQDHIWRMGWVRVCPDSSTAAGN